MTTYKISFSWLLLMALLVAIVHYSSGSPQSYEHNYVRIHVPVIKHTRHHTRTLVKKVPVPVPIPVPVHEDHPIHRWYKPTTSYQEERAKKQKERDFEDDFSSFD